MFCHIIQLRDKGLRLRQEEWPAPVEGSLEMECTDAQHNNFRRTTRQAVLYVRMGVAQRKVGHLYMFDPVLLHTVADGFVLRGIQLVCKTTDQGIRIYEHEQMWLCLTVWGGAAPTGLGERLPDPGKQP